MKNQGNMTSLMLKNFTVTNNNDSDMDEISDKWLKNDYKNDQWN
jgi:hypothetical protein